MSIAQWNSFTNYVAGNEVQNGTSTVYGCLLDNTNQPPPSGRYWNALVPPAGGGLTSLNALTSADNNGNLVLMSDNITFTTDPPNGLINFGVNFPAFIAVTELNTLTGSVGLASSDNTIGITDDGVGRIFFSNPVLTQYGFANVVLDSIPKTETISLPVAYTDSSYAVSIQLNSDTETSPPWTAVQTRADSFTVKWNSLTLTPRTLFYSWIAVGATPAP